MKTIIILILLFTLIPACSENKQNNIKENEQKANIKLENNSTAQDLKIKIIDKIPHDENAYTQGLVYHNGFLYESTGQYGESTLRKLDTNGNIIKQIDIEAKYFAEGISIINNKIYMLTWMETTCFVFDLHTFDKIKEYRYTGQGWGLTNIENDLYLSNGSNNIYVFDEKFTYKHTIPIYQNNEPKYLINEMEFIGDKIYANIYQHDVIAVIDVKSGEVLQEIDASILRAEVYEQENAEVLNGIAYNKEQDIFYLTGKNWKYIFKAKIN